MARDVDLIEEVARHFGYDRLPTTFPALTTVPAKPERRLEVDRAVRRLAAAAGFDEVRHVLVHRREGGAGVCAGDRAGADRQPAVGDLRGAAGRRCCRVSSIRSATTGVTDAATSGCSSWARASSRARASIARWRSAGSARRRPRALERTDASGGPVRPQGRRRNDWRGARPRALGGGGNARAPGAGPHGAPHGPLRRMARRASSASSASCCRRSPPRATSPCRTRSTSPSSISTSSPIWSRCSTFAPHGRYRASPSIVRDLSILVAEHLAPASQLRGTIRSVAPPTLARVAEFDRYQGKGIPDGQVSLSCPVDVPGARSHTDRCGGGRRDVGSGCGALAKAARRSNDAVFKGNARAHSATVRTQFALTSPVRSLRMVKTGRMVDVEPIDRLEEKVKLLIAMIDRLRATPRGWPTTTRAAVARAGSRAHTALRRAARLGRDPVAPRRARSGARACGHHARAARRDRALALWPWIITPVSDGSERVVPVVIQGLRVPRAEHPGSRLRGGTGRLRGREDAPRVGGQRHHRLPARGRLAALNLADEVFRHRGGTRRSERRPEQPGRGARTPARSGACLRSAPPLIQWARPCGSRDGSGGSLEPTLTPSESRRRPCACLRCEEA